MRTLLCRSRYQADVAAPVAAHRHTVERQVGGLVHWHGNAATRSIVLRDRVWEDMQKRADRGEIMKWSLMM